MKNRAGMDLTIGHNRNGLIESFSNPIDLCMMGLFMLFTRDIAVPT